MNKQWCVFPMVILPALRMWQYRVNDHHYHAPQFKLFSPWVVFFWFYFVFYLNERNKWQSASAAWPWHQPESLFRSSLILFLWKEHFWKKFMVPVIEIVTKIVITKSHVRVKKIKRDILEWRSILNHYAAEIMQFDWLKKRAPTLNSDVEHY